MGKMARTKSDEKGHGDYENNGGLDSHHHTVKRKRKVSWRPWPLLESSEPSSPSLSSSLTPSSSSPPPPPPPSSLSSSPPPPPPPPSSSSSSSSSKRPFVRRQMMYLVAWIVFCVGNVKLLTSRSSPFAPVTITVVQPLNSESFTFSSSSSTTTRSTNDTKSITNQNELHMDGPSSTIHKQTSTSQLMDDLMMVGTTMIQGVCGQQQHMVQQLDHPHHPSEEQRNQYQQEQERLRKQLERLRQRRQPKFFFAIPSTLTDMEYERRKVMRETFLAFDQQIRDMHTKSSSSAQPPAVASSSKNKKTQSPPSPPPLYNRACSFQEWSCSGGLSDSDNNNDGGVHHVRDECQIIYAFFVGDNSTGPPYIVDESLTDFRQLMMMSSPSNNQTDTNKEEQEQEEPGLIRLNIRENQFDGKMTTILQFAALVGKEYPIIDYVAKVDSDTMLLTPNFLDFMARKHNEGIRKVHRNRFRTVNKNNNNDDKDKKIDDFLLSTLPTERIYGGVQYPKTFCGKHETHHACPLPLVGDSYMSGELNFMSMDLASFVVSDDCPRDKVTIPHEDVSLSNYVYSYTNNKNVIQKLQRKRDQQQHQQQQFFQSTNLSSVDSNDIDTSIHRIFVPRELKLHTYNESAGWEDMRLKRVANVATQVKRYLWGHCNPRAHGNRELYKFFKTPSKIRGLWRIFMKAYYEKEYGHPAIWPYETSTDEITQAKSTGFLGSAKSQGTGGKAIDTIGASQKKKSSTKNGPIKTTENSTCAIMFFGLPRSFRQFVLPSILRNVVIPNIYYGCDYFMHYYHTDHEDQSRSGKGGSINPYNAWLLKHSVEQLFDNVTLLEELEIDVSKIHHRPNVTIIADTDTSFQQSRSTELLKYQTSKGSDGKLLYFPWKEQNYVFPTTMNNIVKQWHSIERVWKEMEQISNNHGIKYTRVGMLRNDVVFVTPIDVYKLSDKSFDVNNTHVVIPDWANWPVNDRMMIGPVDAVKVWASQRFDRIDQHVTNVTTPGYGMHPERFVSGSVLPVIQNELGYKIDQNKRVCFLRARADSAIWYEDCTRDQGRFPQNATHLMVMSQIIPKGSKCRKERLNWATDQLYCDFPSRFPMNETASDLLWNLKATKLSSLPSSFKPLD